MKKLYIALCCCLAVTLSAVSQPLSSRFDGVATLTSTAQDFTASWVDYGGEISCQAYNTLGIWLTIDINDTQNARIRALAKHTSAGAEEYLIPIYTIGAADVKLTKEYYEFNTDEDQLMLLKISCDNIIPVVQLQISAGTAGATAGQVTASYYTKGY